MKQAIQEGFIIDVLEHYTPVDSYYRLIKTVEGDPEFDTKRAGKKLRRYVEDNDHAIRLKAELMVDNFHEQVAGLQKIGGQARAMVVTSSIQRAISYFYAIRDYLAERKSPYRAIAAFSGEHEYSGAKVTEASLNGFSSNLIADRIQEEPYRFLVCADKFQTGYDEPLLHTMYVDKILSGVKAVQTLSRLNRAHPRKHDAFVLDFANDADTIQDAFADYYRTTVLAEETDPDRLHDLKAALDGYQVYAPAQLDELVKLFLSEADRTRLDPILDACVSLYREQLDEDGQVDFKGKAKAFLRTYGFLAAILPYANAEWEKLSIFLTFLVPKLPAPIEDDLSKGILEAIDMDSYRVEKQAVRDIQLPDQDAEIEPVSTSGGGQKPDPEMERLSNIIKEFNDRFGNIEWKDQDKIEQVIAEELPAKVAGDRAYRNAMANSDQQNARIEHDKALERAMTELCWQITPSCSSSSATTIRSASGSPKRSSPLHITKLPPRPAQQEVWVSERSWGLPASQVAQPHLEDGSVYRQNRPTNVHGRQNRFRDVVGGSVNLTGPWTQSFGLQHSALSPLPPFDGHRTGSACRQLIKSRFS